MVKQSICVCEKSLKKPAAAGSLTLIAAAKQFAATTKAFRIRRKLLV